MANYVARSPHGLGIDPATIASAIAAGRALSGVLSQHPKDRERFRKNAEAYQLATSGHQNALEFLKYRSGRYGIAQSLGAPYSAEGPVGGWATQSAKDDAWKLYNLALAQFGITPDEMPGGGGAVPGGDIGTTDPWGGGPVTTLPPVVSVGRQDYTPLLILAALGAVALVVRRGRR